MHTPIKTGGCERDPVCSISLAAQKLKQSIATVSRRCHRNAQIDGCEYQFVTNNEKLPGEKWKPMISLGTGKAVPGRKVSSLGRIKSKSGHISFGHHRKDGYRSTIVTVSSQLHQERVHRLVAYAFLGPPPAPEHTQINHRDMNKSNNAVGNLEYVTPRQNNLHRVANLKGPNSLWKPVLGRAYASQEKWRHFPSIKEAAQTLDLHASKVGMCARGRQKRTGGYEFRFANAGETAEAKSLPGEEWRDVDLEAHLRERGMRSPD